MVKGGRNIPARRKLAELYVKGKEVRFNENGVVNAPPEGEEPEGWEPPEGQIVRPTDDDVVVWVTPPNPLQREQALREAAGARARVVLHVKKDEESDDAIEVRASVAEMEDEDLLDFVLEMNAHERRMEAQRDVLALDEWEDFEALQDSMRQWAESDDKDDERWKPLLKRDLEFGRDVEHRYAEITAASTQSLKLMPREELERRAIEAHTDMLANREFMSEYERQMLYFSCRDPEEKRAQFFENVAEMLSMPEIIQKALGDALADFIESEAEAKNSPRAEAGSVQSAPPVEPETSSSSTPQAATA